MNIFISWSGPLSHEVAKLFNGWIANVLQAAVPFISSSNIESGSRWFDVITGSARDTATGVIVLTQENKLSHWIHYECGLLSKGLENARLMTLLVDLLPSDVEQPLAQLHHTRPDQAGMRHLVASLNKRLARPLNDEQLKRAFDLNWQEFEGELKKILEKNPNAAPTTGDGPIERLLRETLDTVRRIESTQKLRTSTARRLKRSPAARYHTPPMEEHERAGIAMEIVERMLLREEPYEAAQHAILASILGKITEEDRAAIDQIAAEFMEDSRHEKPKA